MSRTRLLVFCGLIASAASAGEGFYGAWARADAPQKPCLVFTNSIAWTLSKGVWRPSEDTIDECGSELVYCPIGESNAAKQVVKLVDEEDCPALAAQGISVQPGDRIWCVRSADNAKEAKQCCKIVPAAMPKWKKIRTPKQYVGVWEPASTQDQAGRSPIKIRSDLILVEKVSAETADRREKKPYRTFKLRACEGGLRLETKSSRGGRDPLNEYVEGLWLNPKGELVRYGDCKLTVYVRSQEPFDDPVDSRKTVAKDGKLSGTWGVDVEFTTFVLSFCEDGRGILSGFMAQVPFQWKMEKQRIHCVLDKDLAGLMGANLAEFDCEYDAALDKMTLRLPKEAKAIGPRGMPTELPRMPGEITKEQMDAIFKRVEELKQDPQFKMEIERMKRT